MTKIDEQVNNLGKVVINKLAKEWDKDLMGQVTDLQDYRKLWYPCGCILYLRRSTYPQVSLCDQHYEMVWGVRLKHD